MTLMYRLTLDCAHFILHGPAHESVRFYVGESAVCLICPPTKMMLFDDDRGAVAPTRRVVNVEQVPEDLQLPILTE